MITPIPVDAALIEMKSTGSGRFPTSQAVEGELEGIVREWLQDKFNLPMFFDRCFLTLSIGISRDECQWGVHNLNWKNT